ncbi:hypothetical protein [Oligella sp. HMSC09E12]|uniref:hypothetical protein n=1 Tax=Oligella sp. HMSC09E12 TaxID=1581147 RepID=UPI0008A2523F|nr:hypothetical protein [Oligella sp. HMSC09E12]OFV49723.1 hypothetical protein HMPREF3179_03690 [Oligella sp. HMSC09E12]
MKTISLDEFDNLILCEEWEREQRFEVNSSMKVSKLRLFGDEIEFVDVNKIYGLAKLVSTLDGITVTYSESFNYEENDPDSLRFGVEGMDEVWDIQGVKVLDEDGEEVNAKRLADCLPYEFSVIDYDYFEI